MLRILCFLDWILYVPISKIDAEDQSIAWLMISTEQIYRLKSH